MANASVETSYGAAARSMSQSWHDFIFGSFDPAGTITVDKLPGQLWVQALSLRLFGFHIWALVLPQTIEGVLTVLVLYRAVRRLAGPVAGLAAAVALTATPVTVLLGRGNVSDSLLILLLVLAADATSAALSNGKLRWLLLAGVWVGLAFQVNMCRPGWSCPAWPPPTCWPRLQCWRTRLGHVAAAGVVTALVSLSWMSAISLVPAHDRPYVDGSRNDSVFAQVFDYNGLARISGKPLTTAAGPPAPFLITLIKDHQTLNFGDPEHPAELASGRQRPVGRDGGGCPGGRAERDHRAAPAPSSGRRDPTVAAVVLWGGWWVVLAVFFSAGTYLNSYYVAALTPAVAAMCGVGASLCGPPPWPARVRLTMLAVSAVCVGYGLYLLHGAALVPVWVAPTALAIFVVAAGLPCWRRGSQASPGPRGRLVIPVVACASAARAAGQRIGHQRGQGAARLTPRSSQVGGQHRHSILRANLATALRLPAADRAAAQRGPHPVRYRHLRSGGTVDSGHRPRGAADRRVPGRSAGPDPGHLEV